MLTLLPLCLLASSLGPGTVSLGAGLRGPGREDAASRSVSGRPPVIDVKDGKDNDIEEGLDLDIPFKKSQPRPAVPGRREPHVPPAQVRKMLLRPPSPAASVERTGTGTDGAALPAGLPGTSCDEMVCPAGSSCMPDHTWGGSRCFCQLGRAGDQCSQEIAIQYPQFSGQSFMAFEHLKNSFQTFEITLEFRADADGLLLYCGDNEHGRGDFMSLAIIQRALQFRFNCGSGVAVITSESKIKLGTWNTVKLYRDGVQGLLQVNNGTAVAGRSPGKYSKITFRTPLYLGGAPGAHLLARATGTCRGFRGCVQLLTVNGKTLDMRPWPLGVALRGAEVGECSSGVCDEASCVNGGSCTASSADSYICLCPLGFKGRHCEQGFTVVIPQFRESLKSYAVVSWPLGPDHYLSFMEFELTFRPDSGNGVLLYSYDLDSKDFVSVTMVEGHVEFRFDCGSGTGTLRSPEPLALGQWHELRVSRTGKNGILQVDTQKVVEGMAEGAFTQIKCTADVFIGGVPGYHNVKKNSGVLRPFTGSVQKIVLNDQTIHMYQDFTQGVNVENAAHPCVEMPCAHKGSCLPKKESYECDCPLGFEGLNCEKAIAEAIEIPQFIGRSYLMYDNPDILKRVSGSRTNVFMRFKTSAKDGLLLWRGAAPLRANSDFISLGLQKGSLVFSYNLGSGVVSITVNGSFSDGRWHRVKAVREGQSGKVTVDDYGARTGKSPGIMVQLNTNDPLYVGGMKEAALRTDRQYTSGLVGCVSHFTLSADYHIDLVDDAVDGKNIKTCGAK